MPKKPSSPYGSPAREQPVTIKEWPAKVLTAPTPTPGQKKK